MPNILCMPLFFTSLNYRTKKDKCGNSKEFSILENWGQVGHTPLWLTHQKFFFNFVCTPNFHIANT